MLRRTALTGLFLMPLLIQAQDTTKTKELHTVIIVATKNIYKVDSSTTVAKIPLRDLENPQVYNTISKNILKDQVITNLNNSLKNATGITRLWESTGRGGDGAEYYTMRGFSVQPTLMNAMPNITNGTIDPVNIEQIEVVKGPSGTLFGGNIISYGGLINIVTKKPYETFGGELGFVSGAYGLNRFTADINTPLGNGVYARINAAYHDENSFQNAGFNKSFYFAPSLKMVASSKLSFLVNADFRNAESANAPMWFLSRYQPLAFNSIDVFKVNYQNSYTENGLSIKTLVSVTRPRQSTLLINAGHHRPFFPTAIPGQTDTIITCMTYMLTGTGWTDIFPSAMAKHWPQTSNRILSGTL